MDAQRAAYTRFTLKHVAVLITPSCLQFEGGLSDERLLETFFYLHEQIQLEVVIILAMQPNTYCQLKPRNESSAGGSSEVVPN